MNRTEEKEKQADHANWSDYLHPLGVGDQVARVDFKWERRREGKDDLFNHCKNLPLCEKIIIEMSKKKEHTGMGANT